MKTMVQHDIEPDEITYNSFIPGYCVRGETSKAGKVLDIMICEGRVCNLKSYNVLINAHCKANWIEHAITLFDEMLKKVLAQMLLLTTLSYMAFVNREELKRLKNSFTRSKFVGNIFVLDRYNILLDGLFKNERLGEAINLFLGIKEKNFSVNDVTYNRVI